MSTSLAVQPQQRRWLNRIKGVYVTGFLSASISATGYSVYQLAVSDMKLGWLGVLMTTVPFLWVLSRAFVMKNMARTPEHMRANVVWGVVGIGLAVTSLVINGGALPAVLAVSLLTAYVGYDYWYSDLGREDSPVLAIGNTLPDFKAYRGDGSEFSAVELKGSPALIIFFRGNWCPFCVAQIKELVAHYQNLSDRGVKILFISPQNKKHTRDLAKQFNVPCEFLSDKNNQAAELLGIAADGGLPVGMELFGYDSDTVLPTAIIVDGKGRIIYCDQTSNYRVRPEPQEYLSILDQHGLR